LDIGDISVRKIIYQIPDTDDNRNMVLNTGRQIRRHTK